MEGRGRVGWALLAAVVVALGGLWFWGATRVGPEPAVELASDRPAVGRHTVVTARFAEAKRGVGMVRLELVQGARVVTLAEQSFPRRGAFALPGGARTPEATLSGTLGADHQTWLEEGEVLVRAVADRMSGPLRSPEPAVAERRLPVRLRPPRLELVSRQHYVRQGGTGAVVLRVGDTVVRSGVRAGAVEARSYPLPGGGPSDRFALYAVPWDLTDASQVRLFAEDDAGNLLEQPFLDLFRPMSARTDTIDVSDPFLARVVPAIAGQTPGFDASGSLLDQYLRVNRDLRREELQRVAEVARASEPAFLWAGPFLQMPNSKVQATFAQTRSYRYGGREVDRQTHLGLDLASTARAQVPAPNRGRVVFAGWMSLYGNAVVLDHGYGLLSLCGHLSSVAVEVGQLVARGEVIGTSGATGLAGGDHLHLELFVHGQSVDPVEWLDGKWIRDNLGTKLALPEVG